MTSYGASGSGSDSDSSAAVVLFAVSVLATRLLPHLSPPLSLSLSLSSSAYSRAYSSASSSASSTHQECSRSATSPASRNPLQDHIDTFIRDGIVVIPNIIDANEVDECRRQFHNDLSVFGVDPDPDRLMETAGGLSKVSSTGGAGGILDIFYANWKLSLNEHPVIVAAYTALLGATYASPTPSDLWKHPFGPFNAENLYMYIDRCCFRVPDAVSKRFQHKKKGLQRSLTPHLDCCPHNLYSSEKKFPKWRPIQAFVALTDSTNADEGGFEAAPRMHAEFDQWVARRAPTISRDSDGQTVTTDPPCVGDFTPIRPKEDRHILDMIQHIPVKAGDLVCWDYRIAHANARRNTKNTAREVVYLGFLPGINMNKCYAEDQLRRFCCGEVPTDQWHDHAGKQECNYSFSDLGRKMMTIDSYN